MAFDVGLVLTQTISGIIIQLPWFILLYIGFRIIAREIRNGVRKVPSWIEQYEKIKEKERRIAFARG